jgi:hypothetical protein
LAKARGLAVKVRSENAKEAYTDLAPIMSGMRDEGVSLAGIADKLNTEGHTTRRGKLWNPVQVARVLERELAHE